MQKIEDTWSVCIIGIVQQQWSLKNSLIIRLLLRGLATSDLIKTFRRLGCCGSELCRLHPIWKTYMSITSPPASPFYWGGEGMVVGLLSSSGETEKKSSSAQVWTPVWGMQDIESKKRDVWESPTCQPARGREHLCTGWEGTSASESTWIAEDKCSGMAGKLPCLQPFPPFVYLFFFMVLNITSLSLLLAGECFQGLGLHFRPSKEMLRVKKVCPQTVRAWEGLSWIWEKGHQFYLWNYWQSRAGCVWQHLGSASMGGCRAEQALPECCFEHHIELQQCPVSLLLRPAAWQLPEKSGWTSWLCLLHLSSLRVWLYSCIPFHPWQRWDRCSARCSLVRQQQIGPLGLAVSHWVLLAAIELESHVLSAGTIACMYRVLSIDCFCTVINQWGSKCISHLHTFRLGGCVFGMGLTSILAALLRNHSSALTEGFHFSLHIW